MGCQQVCAQLDSVVTYSLGRLEDLCLLNGITLSFAPIGRENELDAHDAALKVGKVEQHVFAKALDLRRVVEGKAFILWAWLLGGAIRKGRAENGMACEKLLRDALEGSFFDGE